MKISIAESQRRNVPPPDHWPYPARMPLPEGVTVIDLRPPELRFAQPLEKLTALPVLAVSLQQIEDGVHGLTPASGPLAVVCERGIRSGLAAKYLRADGLDATAYPGGVPALLRETGRG